VKAHERGGKVSHNVIHLGKTSIPLGGRNFLMWRGCKGLEQVEKGREGKAMLRGSLSNLYPSFFTLLTHYYNFTFLP
jgi:hypothetical protein